MAKNKGAKAPVAAVAVDPILAALANPEVADAPVDTVVAPVPADPAGVAVGDGVVAPDVAVYDGDDDGSSGYGQSTDEPVAPAYLNAPDTVVNILDGPSVAPEASTVAPPEEAFPQPDEPIVPSAPEGVPANPALLQWPSDQYGTCSAIKQPLLDCIGSLNGAEEKLEVFLKTVQMAVEHALVRFENQRADKQASLIWHQEQEAIRNGSRKQKGWQS